MLGKEAWFLALATLLLTLPFVVVALLMTPLPLWMESPWVEESKRMGNPRGYPDEFRKYFAAIEGRSSGYEPYPHNHKMIEFRRAYEVAAKRSQVKLDWVERGPGTVGGRTRTIVVDPEDLNTWYAGAVGGGVWKGTRYIDEFGQERIDWIPLTDHLPSLSVSAMALSKSNPDVIYVGTGEGFGNVDAASGVGIFKTTDRGLTWTQLSATVVPSDEGWRWVNRILISPENPDVVVVATNAGIYRTVNGGSSFDQVYQGPVQDLRAHPDRFDVQFAGQNGGPVLRSRDGGVTWEESLYNFPTGSGRIELAIAPTDPNVVYAAVDALNGELYRTIDGGETWRYVAETGPFETEWLGFQGWYNNTISVHPYSSDTVYLGGINLWKAWITDSTTTQLSMDIDDSNMPFMNLVRIPEAHVKGTLFVGAFGSEPLDITADQLTSVEVRFGQGTQMAHRFSVPSSAGPYGDGGADIYFSEYQYEGYVEVPFQVWDSDNNRQLMVSFRDQADNRAFDLIHFNDKPGERDTQSREYVFIHRYDYDAHSAYPTIAQTGGVEFGMMYHYWPVLDTASVWNPDIIPASAITITRAYAEANVHEIEFWTGTEQVHVDHHSLVIVPVEPSTNEFYIINGNDGGVAYSRDGGESWMEGDAAHGYNTSQFYDATKRPGFEMYMGGLQDNGTWRSYNMANSWRGWIESLPGDGFDVIWKGDGDQNADSLIGALPFNRIWRSLDGGKNWEPGMSGIIDEGPLLTSLGTSEKRPDVVFAIGASGVWRSHDFAGSWEMIPIPETTLLTFRTGKVRVSLANPDVIWAGYTLWLNGIASRLYVSRNGGNTFRPVNAPDMAPTAVISGLATHPWQAQTAYVMFSVFGQPKILRTTDYGETWEDLSGFAHSTNGQSTNGFPDARVYDLEVFPEKNHIIWAGTDMGLFESRDHGATWHYADNGLPAVSVWRLRIEDGEVVVATHGRGVWSLDVTEVQTRTDPVAAVATTFTLEPNYPNPFNPTTTIGFQVPHQSHIRLTVFDGLGRKVATLTDQPYPAGVHQVDWNASHRASGQYFYRLEADGQLVQTRSMTLVK